jgi:hypothetical protein
MRGFSEEWHQLIAVLRDDRQTVRDYYRQRRKEK